MTDARNIAHDKKVQQEKKHKGEDIVPATAQTPQPGKKPQLKEHEGDSAADREPATDGQKPSDKP